MEDIIMKTEFYLITNKVKFLKKKLQNLKKEKSNER